MSQATPLSILSPEHTASPTGPECFFNSEDIISDHQKREPVFVIIKDNRGNRDARGTMLNLKIVHEGQQQVVVDTLDFITALQNSAEAVTR